MAKETKEAGEEGKTLEVFQLKWHFFVLDITIINAHQHHQYNYMAMTTVMIVICHDYILNNASNFLPQKNSWQFLGWEFVCFRKTFCLLWREEGDGNMFFLKGFYFFAVLFVVFFFFVSFLWHSFRQPDRHLSMKITKSCYTILP